MGEIRKILLVAGPTASGKSSLALQLARHLNGELINADSVQFYKGMDIGSAKLMESELQGVKQHLVDLAEPNTPLDVAAFVRLADQESCELVDQGKVPIVVGGSSLYIKALLHGLAELPPGDSEIRAELEELTNEKLYERLQRLDPLRAGQLHPNDRLRVIRAIETSILNLEAGRQSASLAHSTHSFAEVRYQALILCLLPDRQQLYERINRRSALMIESGLIAETAELLAKYGPKTRALGAVGYRQVVEMLASGSTEPAMPVSGLVEAISQATRNYAKQQYTFWRNEPPKRGWLQKSESFEGELTSKALEAWASFEQLPQKLGVCLIKLTGNLA